MNDVSEQHEMLLGMMALSDEFSSPIKTLTAIQNVPFDSVTPATWAAIQTHAKNISELLEALRPGVIAAGKVITNDATYAHVSIVMQTED